MAVHCSVSGYRTLMLMAMENQIYVSAGHRFKDCSSVKHGSRLQQIFCGLPASLKLLDRQQVMMMHQNHQIEIRSRFRALNEIAEIFGLCVTLGRIFCLDA